MILIFTKRLVICVLFLITQHVAFSQTVVYVNDVATGTNNGTSWANAYTNIVDAVTAAPANAEVWIAQTNTEGYAVSKNNIRSEKIVLTKSLTFVGGFLGTEISKTELIGGQHTIISGEIGSNTDPLDNSNTAFHIKNTHVVFEGILFRNFYAIEIEDVVREYGVIVADTNAVVEINNSSFMLNNGNTNGACVTAFKGSIVNISESSMVDNVQDTYGALISRKDDALIHISDVAISNNGNEFASYIFYCTSTFVENTNLQEEVLLDLDGVSFNNNQMPISYSYEGSASFNNCSFNLSATNQANFNHRGDSASFYMNNCVINGVYHTDLFGMHGIKDFTLLRSHILNPLFSTYKFFDLNVTKTITISNSTVSNLRGSVPISIYAPDGNVYFNDFSISNSDVTLYMMYIHANKLNCNNVRLIQNQADVGNYFYCQEANFNNCLVDGFQGGDILNCQSFPVVNFDNCTIKNVHQTETLFRSYTSSVISVTNCTISDISMSVNNPGRATLFSLWGSQTLYAANNKVSNVYSHGNLIDNAGDMFIVNCAFENLTILNSKKVFYNGKKLWVYNSNIRSNYNIPFLNDTTYAGINETDFSLVNSIVYTQQDTVIKSNIKTGNIISLVSNNISNKSIGGANAVSNCTIAYADIYDDAYSIIYNKGFTPVGIAQYPVVDLYNLPRVVDGLVDIGVKEYQLSTAILGNNVATRPITIYPNPTQGIIHMNSVDAGTMRIVDCDGTLNYTETLEIGDNVFNINKLRAGMYFIYVTINGETNVEKLIVTK